MRRVLAALALLVPVAVPAVAAASTVELSQGAEALSGDRPAWRTTALDLAWVADRDRALAAGGSLREASRFREDDVEAAIWAQAPVAGFVLGVEGSASPTWEFLPRWSAGARAERGLGAGWVASLGGRLLRYDGELGASTVALTTAGLERYFGRWRTAASGTAAGLHGAWSGSGRLALDLYYGERGRVGVSVAAGRELESLGGGAVLRTDVLGAALTGAHPLSATWAVTWDLTAQRQGDLYTRVGGRLGVRRSF
ncbi:hypothetical protein A2cp1_3675 [Anaeromyxobacter dehalogenans 2CP-1]|uniref:YaiO beta-barrel domain-containing protein n=1 Tax=Anaeromyxobacter dehalogenans (strain ATCC BAA-258 / DSM 21875 / 2CP-1) TaxID=455488 RepID=B8J6N0_ANAD2|nr:YaiO family outer membrane beta-barrel protein [Anaeromyxobacter dehalogenans]ACL67002.1 hypothetical protein A2cp1_3675 [Anaeromyxobacter dehalogenans 2CP-1]